MQHPSPQLLRQVRESQLNAWASLGVYAGVWAIIQILLRLFAVDMPVVQMFDRFGNLSLPGLFAAALLLLTALVPHWIFLRQSNLGWLQAARLVREFNHPPPADDDPDWAREAGAATSDDSQYWQQRWREVIEQLPDPDRETRD